MCKEVCISTFVLNLKYKRHLFQSQGGAGEERFHQNMFDAVALGIMASKWKCG